MEYDRFLLRWPIFRGEIVSFRECTLLKFSRQSENDDLYDFQVRRSLYLLFIGSLHVQVNQPLNFSGHTRIVWFRAILTYYSLVDCHFWAQDLRYLGHRQHILAGVAFLGRIKVHGEEGES